MGEVIYETWSYVCCCFGFVLKIFRCSDDNAQTHAFLLFKTVNHIGMGFDIVEKSII